MSTILIGADLVPTESNFDAFRNGGAGGLVGEALRERLRKADFVMMNLEVPLTDRASPIRKCGPCLRAPAACAAGLREIDPFFFTLANNHIMDQGPEGLRSTLSALDGLGIAHAGAGRDLGEAKAPFRTEVGGCLVGVYCCAEHEFSIAGEKTPGANPFDPLDSFDDVRELKAACGYVIVLYHGGKEQYRYPSPGLRRVFRRFAEAGADLVVGQHSHCIGCAETYRGSTLVYGQGNFLFDHSDSEYWKTSLLIEADPAAKRVAYIPLVKAGNGVREAEGEARTGILDAFGRRSAEILREGFVAEAYARLAESAEKEYLRKLCGRGGKGILPRLLDKVTGGRYLGRMYPDAERVVIENVLDCEAHRELASAIMKRRAGSGK